MTTSAISLVAISSMSIRDASISHNRIRYWKGFSPPTPQESRNYHRRLLDNRKGEGGDVELTCSGYEVGNVRNTNMGWIICGKLPPFSSVCPNPEEGTVLSAAIKLTSQSRYRARASKLSQRCCVLSHISSLSSGRNITTTPPPESCNADCRGSELRFPIPLYWSYKSCKLLEWEKYKVRHYGAHVTAIKLACLIIESLYIKGHPFLEHDHTSTLE